MINNSDLNERNIYRQASDRDLFQNQSGHFDANENAEAFNKKQVACDDKISVKSSSILGAFKQRFLVKIQNNFKQTEEITETVRE